MAQKILPGFGQNILKNFMFSVSSLAKLSLSAMAYIFIKLLMGEFQRFMAL